MNPYAILGACVAAALVSGYAYHAGYESAEAAMARKVSAAQARTIAVNQRARERTQEAAQAWESERNELQSQVVDLLARGVTVRVCKSASAAAVPAAARSAARADDPPRSQVDRVPDEPNVGPELVRLAGECEGYRRQLTELQDWIASTYIAPK